MVSEKSKPHTLIILFVSVVIIWMFVFIPPSYNAPKVTAADATTIKVLSYNIYHGNELTVDQHRQKVRSIAEYIKANQIEIAGLQEVSTRPEPDVSDMIIQELNAIGYPMEAALPETNVKGQFKNMVLSRYPILKSEMFPQNPCKKGICERFVVVAKIQSPIGEINFIDTHVHHNTPQNEDGNCQSMKQFYEIVKPYQSQPMTIMVGDFNAGLEGAKCPSIIQNTYSYTCEETNNCVQQKMIDWIFLPKTGSQLSQIWRIKDASFTLSDHFPVIALIRSLAPATKEGDLNKDGVVNIFDYNALLGSFGKTGRSGFEPADIIQNGVVDIYDFNALLQNFGK